MIAIMSTRPAMQEARLAQDPQLAALGAATLRRAQVLAAAAGTVLFRAGAKPSRLYYVLAGEALMQRTTRSGDPVILQRASRAFLAEASLTSSRYHCDGICRVDCELAAFAIDGIRAAIDASRETRWAWIEMLAAQSRRQRARIERMSLKTVRERLHHLLLTEGVPAGVYAIRGTRAELAAELGVTPEALYRTLAALQADGSLSFEGTKLRWRR